MLNRPETDHYFIIYFLINWSFKKCLQSSCFVQNPKWMKFQWFKQKTFRRAFGLNGQFGLILGASHNSVIKYFFLNYVVALKNHCISWCLPKIRTLKEIRIPKQINWNLVLLFIIYFAFYYLLVAWCVLVGQSDIFHNLRITFIWLYPYGDCWTLNLRTEEVGIISTLYKLTC